MGFIAPFLSVSLNCRPLHPPTSLKFSTGCLIANSNLTGLKLNSCFSFQTCLFPSVLYVSNWLPVHPVVMTKTWCYPLLLFFSHTSKTFLLALSFKHTPLILYSLHCCRQSLSHHYLLPRLLQHTSNWSPCCPICPPCTHTQSVLHIAVWVSLLKHKSDYVQNLQWLPLAVRIKFKVLAGPVRPCMTWPLAASLTSSPTFPVTHFLILTYVFTSGPLHVPFLRLKCFSLEMHFSPVSYYRGQSGSLSLK